MAADSLSPKSAGKPLFGGISLFLGLVSLIPFVGLLSPISLLLGVIGLFADPSRKVAVTGILVSLIGVTTSFMTLHMVFYQSFPPPDYKFNPAADHSYWGFVVVATAVISGVVVAWRLWQKQRQARAQGR